MPMRWNDPRFTTQPNGKGQRITARFETPETLRMLASLRDVLTWLVTASAALTAYNMHGQHFADWMAGPAMVIASLIAIVAFVAGQVLGTALYHRRFHLRRLTDRTLTVDLSRTAVTVAGQAYARHGVLRFTAVPHRRGREEARAERTRHLNLSTTYRDAWQVWLQHGEAFVLLADVSDEEGAQAIVRRLQTADDDASRGARQDNFGDRQIPP